MAFAVKYRMDWKDRFQGHSYRLDVEIDAYVGPIIGLGHTLDGFDLSYNQSEWVQSFEGVFSFHLEDVDTASYDLDFYETEYKKAKVKFFINTVLQNVGWLKPENTTRQIIGSYVLYRISFTDALRDLEKVPFLNVNESSFSGHQTILGAIRNALEQTGLDDLNFAIQCNTYEDQLMSPEENLFKVLKINAGAFYNIQEGETEADDCFTVLEKCVKPFYCRLAQVGGYWQITNGQEYTSQRDIYLYSTLAVISENVTYGRVVSITGFKVEGSKLGLSKVPPIKKLITTWKNRKLGTNVLQNGNFDAAETPPPGWVNGPNTEAWMVFDGSLARLYLTENSGTGDPNTIKSFSAVPFNIATIGKGEGYFSLSWKMNLKSIGYVVNDYISSPPQYKVRLTYPDGKYIEQNGVIEQGETTYDLNFAELWPVTQTGNYTLSFYYIPPNQSVLNDSQLSGIELEIDDFMLTHNAFDTQVTTDKQYHHGPDTNLVGYEVLEEDIYFADGSDFDDAGVILDATLNSFTKSWSRWGKSPVERAPLVKIFATQYINDREGYFDKITIDGLIDYNEQINFNSILSWRGKTYRFINYNKNYKKKTISGTIQQVKNEFVNGVTEKVKALFAQWGVKFKDLKRMPPPGRGIVGSFLNSPELIFKGMVGIGGIAPTAKFHLPKGYSGLNQAPMKFTMSDVDPVTNEGARLITPEDGAVEYYQTADGEQHLTMTIQGVRYEMTNRIFLEIIDTSDSVITFDMAHQTQKFAKGSQNIFISNTWEFINDENFVMGKFSFLASAFVDYIMPANVTMSDSRFNEDQDPTRPPNSWRPNDLGVYEARIFKDGTYYQIEMFGPFRNLNKAPEIVDNVISYTSGTNTLDGPRTYFDFEGDLEHNPPPQAIDIDLTGLEDVDSVLTLVYTFFSPSGYAFLSHFIQWYRSDEDGTNETEIAGAVDTTTYTTTIDDLGKMVYAKFRVTQTAPAPANGNPTSIEYTSPKKLILEIELAERAESFSMNVTYTAEVTAAAEPPIAWADKILATNVSPTFNTDVDPVIPNLGSAGNYTTVNATKPTYNATNGTLEFRGGQRANGPSAAWPIVGDMWFKGKFTGGNGGNLLSHGNNQVFGNNSSEQYTSNGLTPQAGDTNEHVWRIRFNGANSEFQMDNGAVVTFDEGTTNSSTLVIGSTLGGGSFVEADLKAYYRTPHNYLMSTAEKTQMWALFGY